VAVIVAAGIAAYSNSLQGAFVFDDVSGIVENESICSLWRLDQVLSPVARLDYYRPVLNLSLALCYSVGGLSVLPYHVFNLALHLAAALTLFGLLRRTLLLSPQDNRMRNAATTLSLAAALFWMLHPLQTESVTYVIQRCEAMFGLSCLLSLYCLVRGASSPRARGWYGGAIAACFLGMGSKEATAVTPLLVLLYDRIFLAASLQEIWHKRRGLYAGLALTWGMLVPTLRGATLSQSPHAAELVTIWEYGRSQFGVVVHYLRLSLWPDVLCLDYCWPVAESAREIIPPAIVIGVLVSLVLGALWRRPKWGFLGAFFFITLAPSSSVIPIPDLAFEHRMYLPLAALTAALVLGAYAIHRRLSSIRSSWEPKGSAVLVILVIAIAAALGVRTYVRNLDYAGELQIWHATVTQAPENWRAHANLGGALIRAQETDQAVAHLLRSVEIEPDNAAAPGNLGAALVLRGQTVEGIAHLQKAIEIQPSNAETFNNLGHALLQLGKAGEAVAPLRKALEIRPRYANAHNNLSRGLMVLGHFDEAVMHGKAAVALEPGNAQFHHNLSHALVQLGRAGEAISHCQTALELRKESLGEKHPEYAASLNNLGLMYQSVGDYARAAELIRGATEIWETVLSDQYPDYVAGLKNLASVYHSGGDSGRARAVCRQVLEINPDDVQARWLLGILSRNQRKDQEAVTHWREVLRLQPDQVPVLVQTAWVLATSPDVSVRDGSEAVKLAARAIQLSGGESAGSLDVLAAAYAESGRFAEAVETAKRALAIVSGGEKALAAALRERIRCYEAGSAFRESEPGSAPGATP
jgi:tetratricopeptide (TPR) repeat protein